MSKINFDFISQIFFAIEEDPAIHATLKKTFSELRVKFHQLSKFETELLNKDSSPALSFTHLSKQASELSLSNPNIINKTQKILNSLITNSVTSIDFYQANQKIESLIKNTSHNKSSASQNHKQRINIILKSCLNNNTIPSSCKKLILNIWPNTLLYLLKNHGEQSTHWHNAISIYRELIQSVQPIDNANTHNYIKSMYLSLATKNNNLLILYYPENKLRPAIKSLISYFKGILLISNENLENKSTHNKNHIDILSNLPAEVKPGIWCEIFINDKIPTRRLRLSVLNINTGNLIFVNRNGIKKLEKKAAEFSKELEQGLSRIYTHDTLFNKPSIKTKLKKIS